MTRNLTLTLRRWHAGNSPLMQDIKDFLIAYCACFVAIMAFIA